MYKTIYHVCADAIDGFYSEEELDKAQEAVAELIKDGYDAIRLYQEDYETEEDYEDNIHEEIVLFSLGAFPN